MATVQVNVAGVPTTIYAIGRTVTQAEWWYHCAYILSPTTLSVYLNGVLNGSTNMPNGWTPISSTAGNLIGAYDNGQWFQGNLQDVRISGDIRSPAFLLAEIASQCDPTFVVEGQIRSPTYC
ncbi:MAG TPA: LamG-like jellyroll fold domain-containing protein [Pirellulales bacterium]|nr:LamG-like jellyroll fold domain-containing protein [Pirellulales bacterium]